MAKKKTEERTYYAPIHKKNFFLAAIPFIIIAALWVAIFGGIISAKAQKSINRIDISADSLRTNQKGELEFDMDVTNNSKYRADEINISVSFYEDEVLIGTYTCYTNNAVQSKESKTYTASFNSKSFGEESFYKLKYIDSEKLDIRASITEVDYWDDLDLMSMMADSAGGMAVLIVPGIISLVIVWLWIGKITGSRCDNCKNIFAMTTSASEVGRSAASWNTTKYIKDMDGNDAFSYSARVSGDKVTYKDTEWCKYCGKPHRTWTHSKNIEK